VLIRFPKAIWQCTLSLIFIAFATGTAFAIEAPPGKTANTSQVSNIELTGNFFYSLKRSVPLPFKGIITSVRVQPGQKVQKGEVLVLYRLSPEAVLQIRRSLTSSRIPDLEIKLSQVQHELNTLKIKNIGNLFLAQQQMASPLSLGQNNQEIQIITKQEKALAETLREEKQITQERLSWLREQLGINISQEEIAAEAYLRSPISGYVIWTHTDLRHGAALEKTESLLEIGVMSPMVLRARVHELEVAHLAPGDQAEVSIRSIPGRKFSAQVSRVSWTPLSYAPDQPPYYLVELSVANPDLFLKEGMKGNIILRPR
jgi:multidrug resistance efflux pump